MGDETVNTDYSTLETEGESALARVNRILIAGAGVYSPAQIAEQTGLAVEEVARKTQEIFESIDALDLDRRRKKLMMQLEAIVAEAQSRIATANDRSVAPIMNSSAGAIGRALKELERQEKSSSAQLDALNAKRRSELREIVERSYSRMLGRLEERFGVDADDLEDEFQGIMLEVAREHDAR